MKKIKAIIVDDLIPYRELIVIQFMDSNIDFLEAFNGLEAIELLKKNNDIELIITDIEMPGMNGLDLCRFVRNSFMPPKCNIVIIGMTSYDADNEKEYLMAGFNDVIEKTEDNNEIAQAIKKYLNHLVIP